MLPNLPFTMLKNFPNHRLFQFFVDGSMHAKQNGEEGFENREPGCMAAFYNAFDFALSNIDKKLSLELISQIHALASENVRGDFNILKPGKFRDNLLNPFVIRPERFTKEGIKSFMTAAESGNNIGVLTGYSKRDLYLQFKSGSEFLQELIAKDGIEKLSFYPPFETEGEVRDRATSLLNEFEENLAKAKSQDSKDQVIKAIVHFVRFMELLHPFDDANGRVFVNIVLNLLLIQNNFLPVTLYEPNIFDFYSDDELVDAIKDAMGYTLSTIKNPDHSVFGYVAPKKTNEHAEQIKKTISSRIDQNNQSQEMSQAYFAELESYCDSAWDGNFNVHRWCGLGELSKIQVMSEEELKLKCNLIAPEFVTPLYKGLTPLHIACKMNNADVAAFLIKIDKNLVNLKDAYGNTPLYYAIQSGNLSLVETLLNSDAELDVSNLNREKPLDWVAKYAGPDIFNQIQNRLNQPPFSDLPDEQKLRIIQLAASNDNYELIKWIFSTHKTNLTELMMRLKNEFGTYSDPLVMALAGKSGSTFEFLLPYVFPNKDMKFSIFEKYLQDIVKNTNNGLFDIALLHTNVNSKESAIRFGVFEKALFKEHRDFHMPDKLLELEKNIANIKDYDGSTLLCHAAALGLKDISIKLIEAGCDPHYDFDGETPLSLAAHNNKVEMIEYLIKTVKMDPDYVPLSKEQDSVKFSFFPFKSKALPLSALATAVRDGNIESAKLLLDLGATITDQVESKLSECKHHQEELGVLLKSRKKNPD